MDIFLVSIGLIALLAGGELLVRGAVSMARGIGMSSMVIGITLVGFGTSAPELAASLNAALAGSPGIAVGNVVGSNISNILLILGLAAIISALAVPQGVLARDGAVMLLATVLCVIAVLSGTMGRLAGLGLFLVLVLYLVATFWLEHRSHAPETVDDVSMTRSGIGRAALLFTCGLIFVLLGAHALVSGAIAVAADLGLSEALIGLTIVAVGTSMPELVTSVIAARKGEGEVALGNILGSNVFNILGILGVTALVQPLNIPDQIAAFDIWVMLGATVLLLVLGYSGARISRAEGALLFAAYLAYMGWLIITI
ncbi:calcium/sodium antiporter [Roseovarius pelagicus]|uniref:Calcium/sodium antiporter n=1 Tax=Roseovarius pelagicus TaxID=2980108 RepID=A0ABY6DBX0_9RHOB|nr:calcium/sodium antiporter [Roseovarius pelagicus]UXX83654.1 calcium/sodium antiporter [Roseovarius pelagicus]